MIAETVHIYTPDEIDKIQPLSEMERCANYVFEHIRMYADDRNSWNADHYYQLPIIFKEHDFSMDIIARIVQLLHNAGWRISHGQHSIFIHKSHFE